MVWNMQQQIRSPEKHILHICHSDVFSDLATRVSPHAWCHVHGAALPKVRISKTDRSPTIWYYVILILMHVFTIQRFNKHIFMFVLDSILLWLSYFTYVTLTCMAAGLLKEVIHISVGVGLYFSILYSISLIYPIYSCDPYMYIYICVCVSYHIILYKYTYDIYIYI